MKFTPLYEWVRHRWIQLLTSSVLLCTLAALYLFKLTSLVGGVNSYEIQKLEALKQLSAPWTNPVDWPYLMLAKIVTKIGLEPLFALRIVSVCAGLLSVLLFYYLLRNWLFSSGKALIGTLLFATSSWQLSVVRGGYAISFSACLLILFFMLSTRVLYSTRPFLDWFLLLLCASAALYSPLLPWFVFVGAAAYLVQTRGKLFRLSISKRQSSLLAVCTALLALPMLVGVVQSESTFRVIFMGDTDLANPLQLVANASNTLFALFFKAEIPSVFGLANLPFLDVFSVLMFILGLYYFERRLNLRRSRMVLGSFAAGIIVVSLAGYSPQYTGLLVPLVYLIVAAGVYEFTSRWLVVFPKNPVARSIGISLISICIGVVGSYHLTRYFVARTGNPDIQALYVLK